MSEKSVIFLKNNVNLGTRRKIDGCYANLITLLDDYEKHCIETSKEMVKTPADFLKQDFLLEMMAKDFDCYQDVLELMSTYIKTN